MTLYYLRGEVEDARSSSAGHAIAIDRESCVGLNLQVRKFRLELLAMQPAHADPIAFEQAGPRQDERAGAQSDQRDAASCSLLQKRDRACRYPLAAMKKTSEDRKSTRLNSSH